MKKHVHHWLIMLLFITPVFMSCNNDTNMGEAIITIDPESTKKIDDEGNINIRGTVESPSGSVIENISFMVVFLKEEREDPWDEEFKLVEATEWVSGIGRKEFKEISKNKYEFTVTQENNALATKSTVIKGIRINARVKDGERSSKAWEIRPQFKI